MSLPKRPSTRASILAAAALVGSGPGWAPPAGAQATRQPPAWQMDWGDQFCTLIRRPTPQEPRITAFRMTPGHETGSFLIGNPQGSDVRLPSGVRSLVLLPSGSEFEVEGQGETRPGGMRVLVLSPLTNDFWTAFASATALQVKTRDAVVATVSLPQAAAATRAHRQCVSDGMREWGLDEAALASLKRWPKSTNGFGLSSDDYPSSAVAAGTQGRVVVRVDVSAEGRATACSTLATSDSPDIDKRTCQVILQRARFEPAIGPDDRPVAVRVAATVVWLMPS